MSKLFRILLFALVASSLASSILYSQADTTLAGLLAGRLRWDSRDQRRAVARELFVIYTKLDTVIPFGPEDEFLKSHEAYRQLKRYDQATEQQLRHARVRVNGIMNCLRFIVDSTQQSLRKEMFFWVSLCLDLLDDEVFHNIARLSSEGIISVPKEFALSNSVTPGSQSRRYARAIIEHLVQVYLLSLKDSK